MVLKLYNTFGRKKQVFKSIKKNEVGIYTCGLTVYNYGHIGNYRAFVSSDILARFLEYGGYKVRKVVNITDVDDKTIKGSIEKNESLNEYTKKYEKAFFEDEKKLNIKKAYKYPRATKHIKEMVEIISKLMDKKIAYKVEDGIYFDISKFKNYGKLSGVKIEKLKEGASERVEKDEYEKENANDFALWKFYDNEDGEVFWKTKLGKGRPGWHIECSAMSTKYLGDNFDIHTGGIDLVFPHHENEIAQSEPCTNKKLANYWIHNEWMMIDGKKMSKSLGNYYTIRDIIDMGYDPLSLRYFYLTGNYRTQLNFTLENLKNTENSLKRLRNILSETKDDKILNKKYLKAFELAMDNDLDTVTALQVLWKLIRDEKAKGKIRTIKEMDKILGLDLLKKESVEIPGEVMKLVEERNQARANRSWGKADDIRKKINKLGFRIDDTKKGSKVSTIKKY